MFAFITALKIYLRRVYFLYFYPEGLVQTRKIVFGSCHVAVHLISLNVSDLGKSDVGYLQFPFVQKDLTPMNSTADPAVLMLDGNCPLTTCEIINNDNAEAFAANSSRLEWPTYIKVAELQHSSRTR